jgi:hypothetical protein
MSGSRIVNGSRILSADVERLHQQLLDLVGAEAGVVQRLRDRRHRRRRTDHR